MQEHVSPALYAQIVLQRPVGPLTYQVPEALKNRIHAGVPVRIPLGQTTAVGYVADIQDTPPKDCTFEIREIADMDAERPVLPEGLMKLVLFAADYYFAPYSDVLKMALPASLRVLPPRFRITEQGKTALNDSNVSKKDQALLGVAEEFPKGFRASTWCERTNMTRAKGAAKLRRFVKLGFLERLVRGKRNSREILAYERVPEADVEKALTPRQKKLRAMFDAVPKTGPIPARDLAHNDNRALAKLKTLERAGLLCRVMLAPPAEKQTQNNRGLSSPLKPTVEQRHVIGDITQCVQTHTYQTFLLHGVTGSGKTEVYLQVIAETLALGKTALVLVPEIALTPQLGATFRGRFGDRVAIVHSALTPSERLKEWNRVLQGEATIGLGARSALFLPLSNLGVVVVDEEYETSFKQEESPRYNARDLAVVRGFHEKAVVVLGSATPSLETWNNAEQGRYQRLSLHTRVHQQPLPHVEILSLAGQARSREGILTAQLVEAMEQTLSAQKQVILFVNRRGYAPYVFCKDCGHAFRCPDCDVALTLHQRRRVLLCHYCAYEEDAPDVCAACQGHKLHWFGLGTERIESELETMFPNVSTARLDSDTVRKRGDLDRQLTRFKNGEASILVGTQMVAKGHDFPGVTLVGVVLADANLNLPDFRSAERTFQLLTQVAGRAGRAGGDIGKVLVQAYETNHYAITTAADQDYASFVEQELKVRRELDYPPFSHMALVRIEDESANQASKVARQIAETLQNEIVRKTMPVKVLGPSPAPLARLCNLCRFQILIKAKQRSVLRHILRAIPKSRMGSTRQILDVDPYSML